MIKPKLAWIQPSIPCVVPQYRCDSPFSHGFRTSDPAAAQRGELDPKLRELGVPVYFAGHDHSTWAKHEIGEFLEAFPHKQQPVQHLKSMENYETMVEYAMN